MATAIGEQAKPARGATGLRSKAPVFVLGCPRSGTTLLYHMLLSAGGFAVYRAESQAFNLLAPRFGNFKSLANRERLLENWLRSKLFQVSGLDGAQIRDRILRQCDGAGAFLQTYMQEIVRQQGAERWAECTPDHLLYIQEIKRQIPEALVIHIIRDGRDVALSYARQGWTRTLPWDRGLELLVSALYWSWTVRRGRRSGAALGADYMEARYEELVEDPRETLARVGRFIEQELDYDRIQKVGIGSVSRPNSSFSADQGFNPVGRWQQKMGSEQLSAVERLIGDLLQDLGYPLAGTARPKGAERLFTMRALYPQFFAAKLWLKDHTWLGRTVKLGPLEIED
jgi:sulfotransferase family protein